MSQKVRKVKLRIDCRIISPNGYHEVGLVDYADDEEANTPTIFVGAYLRTPEDREWFKKTIKSLTSDQKVTED